MKKKKFLGAEFSDRFKASYAAQSQDRRKGTDKVVLALMKQEPTPGMRVKPIQPERHYNEARINAGDRLTFRIGGGKIWFVDVVEHDDIDRYGKRIGELF